jgi:HK97 family phage major capsid protein
MNTQESINAFKAERAKKYAELEGIMEKSAKSGETLDVEQSDAYDGLEKEIEVIDKHLARLERVEKLQIASATRVPVTPTAPSKVEEVPAATKTAPDGVIAVPAKLEKGIAFARFAKSMVMAGGNAREALEIVKERYPNEQPLHNIVKMHVGQGRSSQFIEKAAVDAAITTNAPWAGALVQYQQMADDFIEYLRPQTIIGRLPGLRKVPFKVRIPRQTGGGTASWVGEGKAKPLTSLAFDNVVLDFTKIATIAVLTDEIVRLSTPSAEAITRDQLAAAIIQQMDSDFIDPHNAGTANVKPASITNGVTPVASSGNAEANVRQDILAVFQPWITSNLTPNNATWIMSATTALALSLMVNGLGQPSFPGLTMNGGTLWGLPVVVSEAAGIVGGSDGGHIVVLVNQRDILLADDGTVAVDASREASLEMSDAPTSSSATATGASLVSMFQTNSVAIRAERWINWVKGRSTAVQFLSSVNWGQA